MTRVERDFLGEVQVPEDAYYGAHTARAVENFPISALRLPPVFNHAMAHIKKAAALTHAELGKLPMETAEAIARAADEVIAGKFDDQFVVDAFQAGAGTSQHMNVNEVIANRATEMLGGRRGEYRVHPNDHVNMGQSTNDVFPTTMRLSLLMTVPPTVAALDGLAAAFAGKAEEFRRVVKSGRTHLQDAVPVTLGDEFGAYATVLRGCARDVERRCDALRVLGIGGSATGSGLNTAPGYRRRVVERLSEQTGIELVPAEDLFAAMQSMKVFVDLSGALAGAAVELGRVANDLRLLSSGPRTGLAEIRLPAVQPGSSIMPGKVNPVMAECTNMVCFHVLGNDACVRAAAGAGQLELNVMMPVIAYNLLQSTSILGNVAEALRVRCVEGIEAD